MSDSASVARPGEIAPAVEPTASEETVAAADAEAAQQARTRALEMVQQAGGLPAALRERLAAAIAASATVGDSSGLELPLATVITAVEESLPEFLRGRGEAATAGHPAGEAFFTGAAGELSDGEAEALAQQQLARCGLLRGQKVRVAD